MSAESRFEALFRDHARPLLGYALRRVDRSEDAADIVSETMLTAWRRLDDVPTDQEARLWLYGVARKVLANHRRTIDRATRLGAKLRSVLGESTVRDHAERVGTGLVVREALARLDGDDREILCLSSWEGLTPAEVAVVLGVPSATARTRLHRSRARLRVELAALGWTSEREASDGHVQHDEHVLVRKAEGES
jgi:RNA polymerase sigma-70 factor (ECF subfamily)